MTTSLATLSTSLLMDVEAFNHMQRVGKMLAISPLFPEHLRKGGNDMAVANGVLVLNMAARLREDPLTVAQNIYFVGGKPGWAATYMIGKANQHGVFRDTIDWEVNGSGESLSVTAFATLAMTGKRVSATCDMAMAKAEGWTKNPKYQSMPQQMLRYRSATFLIRLYCPEVMIGMPTTIELETGMKDITPDDGPSTITARAEAAVESTAVDVTSGTENCEGSREKAAEEQREPEPAQRQQQAKPAQRRDSGPYAEGAKKLDESKPAAKAETIAEQGSMFPQDEPAKAEAPDFASNAWGKSFLTDVGDMGFDEAYSLHEAQFQQVKDEHPDLHSWLMERVGEIEAQS